MPRPNNDWYEGKRHLRECDLSDDEREMIMICRERPVLWRASCVLAGVIAVAVLYAAYRLYSIMATLP